MDIKVVFTTDVVATLVGDTKTGPYFQEATAQWTMDLSGTYDAPANKWKPINNLITPSGAWGGPKPPLNSQESTSGPTANNLKKTWTT